MLKQLTIAFRQYSFLPALLCLVMGSSCSKPKEDQRTGNLVTTLPISASTVRLVNLASMTDLEVNGVTLTNLVHPVDIGQVIYPVPTKYFPTSGKIGATYNLPQELLNAQGSTRVRLFKFPNIGSTTYGAIEKDFTVTEDYYHPNDYYTVFYRDGSPISAQIVYSDSVFVVPRAASPAVDPTHIRIRLLNLSSAPDNAELTGPMSLAFADGSAVSATTSNIATGKVSDYIEMPCGTYQFKVLTNQGAQVPGININAVSGETINQFTAVSLSSGRTFATIQSFQPGGVYTIVVSAYNGFFFPSGANSFETFENAVHIITDIAPAANLTYARVQAGNALPGNITVKIDEQSLADHLPADSASDYQVFSSGNHYVEVLDAKGGILAQQMLNWTGSSNYTIWAYPKTDGNTGLLFAENNLSGTLPKAASGDGSDNTYGTIYDNAPTWIRFLNLCPDLPLVTFTRADGQPFPSYYGSTGACAQNLALGQPSSQPFQYVTSGGIPSLLQVYQSKPLIVPGTWLSAIAPLHSTDFIRSPASAYPNGMPAYEPGVYTVALTGRYNPNGQGPQAKMIIIKHTR